RERRGRRTRISRGTARQRLHPQKTKGAAPAGRDEPKNPTRNGDAWGTRGKTDFQTSIGEVVGGGECENALVALDHQGPLEEAAALVVEEIFVPTLLDEFGNDDDDATVGMLLGESQNELNDGNYYEAVGGRKSCELRRFQASLAETRFDVTLPIVVKQFGMFFGLDVDGDDFGRNSGREFEGLLGDAVPAIDGDDGDGWGLAIGGHDWGDAASGNGYLVIVEAYVAEK